MPDDDPVSGRGDLLSEAVPWVAVLLLAVVLVAAWVAVHRLSRRHGSGGAGGILPMVARVAVGAAACWAVFQTTGRWLVLGAPWSLAGLALAAALAVEVCVLAYGWERRQLGPRRGAWVLGLRLTAVAIVVFMLLQPVFTRDVTRRIEREVAVLVDDSRSMRLVDGELDASERLRLAVLYGVEGVAGLPSLDGIEGSLAALAKGLEEPFARLAALQGGGGNAGSLATGASSSLAGLGDSLSALADAADDVVGEAARVASALGSSGAPENVQSFLATMGADWRSEVAGGLEGAGRALDGGQRVDLAFEGVRRARDRVRATVEALSDGRRAVDGWLLAQLPDSVRGEIDSSARRTRAQIARDVLALPGAGGDAPLVDALAERYGLRFVRFGREAVEVESLEALGAAPPGDGASVIAGEPVAGQWVGPRHPLRFFVPGPGSGGLPDGWSAASFDDRAWRQGRGVLGFSDDPRDRQRFDTSVEGEMRNRSPGILLRFPFDVDDPANFDRLALHVRYDDGFVALLNGVEIARRGVPDGALDQDAEAVADRVWAQVDAGETIDVSSALAHVVPGRNVLAVHAVNAGRADNDLLVAVTLAAGGVPEPGDDAVDPFVTETDIAGAIESTLERISPDSLAGVLLLSDGRHNADSQVEDVARRMGIQGTPVGAVAVGAAAGPPDASILDVQVPESIYLGDKIVVRAELKADGLRGRRVHAVLEGGDGRPLDEVTLDVPDARFTTSVRFRHVPDAKGIDSYRVRLEPVEGELFPDNNEWAFEVAVTDDRKNVLLVDLVPRWEFRYLRNLFFARDKSVHLQYVLLDPEGIEGVPPLPPVAASASRPFGEAEATRLPASREEWLKFDAIIIGDVPPAVFGEDTWAILDECVRERGAMLVVVAGPRFMPHAFDSRTFRELMPIEFDVEPGPLFDSVEPSFRLELTAEGRGSEIMRQAPSGLVNAQIWGSMPELYWRHPHRGAKETASVLAYATDPDEAPPGSFAQGQGFDSLLERRETERRRALIAAQRLSPGSVCLLMTDRTWRFRSGVGDTYHHRFWGQLLRWGTGENLRSGTEFARLGTDRLSYAPGDPVRILARLSDRSHRPLRDDRLEAVVYRDGEEVARSRMTYREGSNGMHELALDGFEEDGRYRVVVDGAKLGGILTEDGMSTLDTEFRVRREANPRELAELTVDLPFLDRLTSLSGGRLVTTGEARELVTLFGEPSKLVDETRETTLWDTWPLLLLFIGVVTAEWLVRRQGGLV